MSINKKTKVEESKPLIGETQAQVSQLNKPLIYSLVAIALMVFVFVLINSFQGSSKAPDHTLVPIKKQGRDVKAADIQKSVQSLPSSYN